MIPLVLLSSALGFSRQAPVASAGRFSSPETVFVSCNPGEKPKTVFSPVSLSEDEGWRAYVEVDVQGEPECLYTSRLWVGRADAKYRMLYLMPPERTAVANGIKILGWAEHSSLLLVRTEQWQVGSDAQSVQRVLAIEASSGMVYEPELEAIMQARREKQCTFRVTDAGFAVDKNVNILIRAHVFTLPDVDQSENGVPPAKRCADSEETWSFNYGTGEIMRVANAQRMQLVRNSQPNPHNK